MNVEGTQQYGGVVTVAIGETCHRVADSGQDPKGLGRWSWIKLQGQLLGWEDAAEESEIVSELYDGDENNIINLIASQEDRHKHLLLIGHNPLIYNVAMSLANSDSDKYNMLISTSMPTARIIVIDFPNMDNWKKILTQKGDIIEIFTPSL